MADNDTDILRSHGNEEYNKACDPSLSPQEKIKLLDRAISWYKRALVAASTSKSQGASASKNIATATKRKSEEMRKLGNDPAAINEQFEMAISHFQKALEKGENEKPAQWLENITMTCLSCVKQAVDNSLQITDVKRRVEVLSNFLGTIDVFPGRQYYLLQIVKDHQHVGDMALAQDRPEFKEALYHLKESQQPLEQLLQQPQTDVYTEAQSLRAKLRRNLDKAEALQSLDLGEKLYKSLEHENEDKKIEMIFDAIDHFRQAIIKTREKEIHLEAEASYRLGRIYDTVLNNTKRAQQYYKEAIFLWGSLGLPTLPSSYQEAKEALERYQQREKERDGRLVEQDIKKIQEAKEKFKSEHADFIYFILNNYTPKKRPNIPDIDELRKRDLKKLESPLMKVVLVYHPDKQKKYKDDKNWKDICDEITKQINSILELCR